MADADTKLEMLNYFKTELVLLNADPRVKLYLYSSRITRPRMFSFATSTHSDSVSLSDSSPPTPMLYPPASLAPHLSIRGEDRGPPSYEDVEKAIVASVDTPEVGRGETSGVRVLAGRPAIGSIVRRRIDAGRVESGIPSIASTRSGSLSAGSIEDANSSRRVEEQAGLGEERKNSITAIIGCGPKGMMAVVRGVAAESITTDGPGVTVWIEDEGW